MIVSKATVENTESAEKTTSNYEDVVEHLGGFGKYQKRVFVLMCFLIMSIAIQTLLSVFSLYSPHHRCAIPELDNDTFSASGIDYEKLLNLSIPLIIENDKPVRSRCLLYRNRNQSALPVELLPNRSTVSCHRWVFDHSTFSNTFTEEEGLVCDKKEYHAFADTMFMVGKLVGSFFIGIFCDLFGRKRGLMLSIILHVGCAVGGAFVPNFTAYTALRFIMGGANLGVFLSAYILGLELVECGWRMRAGQLLQISWSIGLFPLVGVAYGLRDWRHLQLAVSCPSFLFLSYYWFIDESPRWLISKGRYDKANAVLLKVARINGQPAPPKFVASEVKVQRESGLRMFTHPTTLIRTLIVFFNWIVTIMIYYGLSLNAGNIGGNLFVNFTLSAVAELLGYAVAMAGLDRVGRKIMYCGSMIIGGLALLATMFPVIYGRDSVQWTIIMLSNIGKLGASSAVSTIYLFSTELFPTVARNSLVGLCSMISRLGGIASPYLAQLNMVVGGDLGVALSLVVFGGSALVAGMLALGLPETLHRPLPDTIQDARDFGKKPKLSSAEQGNRKTYNTNEDFKYDAKSDSLMN